ncbi:MAG: hypothetical protein LUE93_00260 [Bacteroides sp.]|nr:hypothetical protein [Bacteroides sp.]
MKTDQPDMIKIWNDFRSGNQKAFSLLYEYYFDILYRYGMKFVSDENIVKDSIQDLFIKIYNNRDNLSSTTEPKFYLLFSLKKPYPGYDLEISADHIRLTGRSAILYNLPLRRE